MATTQQLVVDEVLPPQQPQIVKYSLSHFHKNRRRNANPARGGGGEPTAIHQLAAKLPSVSEMERRQAHRQQILASTETHLRTYDNHHHHHHNDDDDDELEQRDTSRNILYVLMDRERRGPRTVISLARYRRFQKDHHRSKIPGFSSTGSTTNAGDRSPSTVLESPPTPAAAARDNNENQHHVGLSSLSHALNNNNNNSHRRHLSGVGGSSSLIIMEEQETSFNTTEEEEEDVDDDQVVTPNSPTTTTRPWQQTKPPSTDEPTSLRRVSYPLPITRELQSFAEYASAVRYHSACLNHLGGDDIIDADGNRPVSSHAVSTISIAFSCDGRTVASTHGDHTVKISCCVVGILLQCLDGHPRTPWTVKYHPTNPHILASGCLGHQVRIWDWPRKLCLQMVRLEFAIISLAFHPSGELLAIANGTKLHFWGINNNNSTSAVTTVAGNGNNNNSSSSSRLMESDQKHMLRCVHFPPSGDTIIIGGANPMQEDPRQRRRNNNSNNNQAVGGNNGMSFYLRLWDFDLERALEMPQYINNNNNIMSHSHAVDNNNNSMRDSIPFGITMGRRSISNVRFLLFCFRAPDGQTDRPRYRFVFLVLTMMPFINPFCTL
jgi:WD domain, G-beta repeat